MGANTQRGEENQSGSKKRWRWPQTRVLRHQQSRRPKEQQEDKGQKATKAARQRAKQTNGQQTLHKCVVNFNWDTGKEKHRKQTQAPTNIKADNSQQCWETNEGRHAHQQQVGHIYSRKKRPPTPTVNCFFCEKAFIFIHLYPSLKKHRLSPWYFEATAA